MTDHTAEGNGQVRQAPCAFFDDGYTRTGKILVDFDFHPELNFQFRPLTETQRNQIVVRVGKVKPNESEKAAALGERLIATVIAEQVKEWDLLDRNQTDVVITTDNCLLLEPGLGAKLFNIVVGKSPPIERTKEEREKDENEELSLASEDPEKN